MLNRTSTSTSTSTPCFDVESTTSATDKGKGKRRKVECGFGDDDSIQGVEEAEDEAGVVVSIDVFEIIFLPSLTLEILLFPSGF